MSYHELVENQRAYWRTGATRCHKFRKEQLEKAKKMFMEHKKELDDAVYKDLRRPPEFFHEVETIIEEINSLLVKIDEWDKPEKKSLDGQPLFNSDDDAWLVREPLGVVLIMTPWNGPVLTSGGFVTAIAGGNTAVLKPSELSPTVSATFSKLAKQYFDPRIFAVVEGGVPETTELLKERFDQITYTGNPMVARIIMTAAAKNLTPVLLELGGKNPALIMPDADVADAAKKIAMPKCVNCGQICLSPDYILIKDEQKAEFVDALTATFESLGPLKNNPMFHRIIHERHFDRLSKLISSTRGKLLYKGKEPMDRADKFIPPHVFEVDFDDPLMQEEIFGPIIVIIRMTSFDDALTYIKSHEKPLGAYIFTKNPETAKRFIRETSSGGVTVNDVMMHAMARNLPFGGVGNSGLGKMRGKYTYDAMTHVKSVLSRNAIGPQLDAAL